MLRRGSPATNFRRANCRRPAWPRALASRSRWPHTPARLNQKYVGKQPFSTSAPASTRRRSSRRGSASTTMAHWPTSTGSSRYRARAPSTHRRRSASRSPICRVPYSLAVVQLDNSPVRVLLKVTGVPAGETDHRAGRLGGVAQDRDPCGHTRLRVRILARTHGQQGRGHEKRRDRGRGHDALRRALRPRHQGPGADGVTEAVAHVDKGFRRRTSKRPGSASCPPPTASPPGILADTCGLLDIPVTRVENACATGNDAIRNGTWASPAGSTTWCWWSARTRCARPRRHHVLGVDGDDPRHGLGLPARVGRAGQLRAARQPLPARVAGHQGAHGDGRGEEPPPRGHQPEGAAALRDHHRAGAQRADGGRAVRALRLHAPERRRRRAAARGRRGRRPLHRPAGVGARRRARASTG